MKVRDLIEKLRHMNQDAEVVIDCDDGYEPQDIAGVGKEGDEKVILAAY